MEHDEKGILSNIPFFAIPILLNTIIIMTMKHIILLHEYKVASE